MDAEMKSLLERGVSAVERLAEDPVIHMETGPPVCPNCDRKNPVVRVEESSATGLLGEFVIQCHCQHCDYVFYGIPIQWNCVKTTSQASEILKERAELSGYEHS
jgi:hypothetical protein